MPDAATSRDESGKRLLQQLPRLCRYAGVMGLPPEEVSDVVLEVSRAARTGGLTTAAQLLAAMRAVMAGRSGLGDGAGPAVPEPSPDPVLQVIRGLPAEQAEVLLLVCAEQLGYRQTARLLEQPMEAVADRLLQGRRQIGRAAAVDGGETSHDDDLTCMAFADGELNERARQGVERAMDANEIFVERTALFIRTAALAKEALDTLLAEPVPAPLQEAVLSVIAQTAPRFGGPLAALANWFSRRGAR